MSNNQKCLVLGTWALALISLASLITTAILMSMEIDEMERATNIQLRPFAIIEMMGARSATGYWIGPKKDTDNEVRDIAEVAIGSDAHKARSNVQFTFHRKLHINNIGKTPMWLKKRATSTLLSFEWIDQLNKDPQKTVDYISSIEDFKENETDIVIMPDTFYATDFVGYTRNFSVEYFDSLVNTKSDLITYPYTLIEYEDYLGNSYKTLRVYCAHAKITIKDSIISVDPVGISEEKFRFDL